MKAGPFGWQNTASVEVFLFSGDSDPDRDRKARFLSFEIQ